MDLLSAYQEMIKVHGWNGTAATLGMTKSALEARVYEVKGSGMRVDTALLIQAYAGTTHFAQAVAHATGGAYVDLPIMESLDSEALDAKFHELYEEIGELSKSYRQATKDGEIDLREKDELEAIAHRIHKTMKELMAVMFCLFCRPVRQA